MSFNRNTRDTTKKDEKNQLSQCNCSVLQCRSRGNFLTEASPLQRQLIAACNQHEEYWFRVNICKSEERPFMIPARRLLKCIYKSEVSNVNIFGKNDNIRQDLVMYTFFPGFSVFFVFYYRAGEKWDGRRGTREKMGDEENEKGRTRWVIETNGGVHKGNRGKERKVMLITELPREFIDSCDISSLICL